MPQCTLISTATSFNMSHARLMAYSSLASICKTKMVHDMFLMLPNHFVITNILRNPSRKPPCSISWHVWHISRMPQCTLISTATSFNMSHARLMAYSSLASICKTKMVHDMLLMLPNHFVITNILRNPSRKPPCSISWHVWHISRMPQCTLISTATSFNMSHARLMAYSSLASICKTKMVHDMFLMLPNHFVITNILRNPSWKPPCSILWHVRHISRMPQCTLISTATSFNMSHARLMAYSSLASICKTKMVHDMLLMLPNHFVITNILRNPSRKPPCSISWHVRHISRMPQCTLISTATSFNMSHARLMAYSSLASICKTKMVHDMFLMLPNHFVITNILRNPSRKPPCSISWHVWHISRMPQCTLISTATSFNMSHARLMAYSSLASICKTKMVHDMFLMLPNHFVITNILRNPSWKPPCSISWHVWHISRMPQCTLISTATSFNMSHAGLMAYSSLASNCKVHEKFLMLPNHFVITNILRNPSWKPPCSISWHVRHISRMPQCTLISTATSFNMSHARLMAYSSLASICKTKMVHDMFLMLPNHFVITNILRNPSWKPPCSISWHVRHISRMPQCTLISTATSFNMSHARLMAYSSLASICKTKMVHDMFLMLPNHFVITNILRNPSWKPPCSISWHARHISRMPQCTLISTATSFNMSHARLMAYSSLASICKTKMVHDMFLMLPNHFVITNILRNPSWKPPCSISRHVRHISRMPQWTLISTATSFNMSHARLMAYSSLASICKTKMVHDMFLMLPNHFVITNILRNPSWKPPCSISWHARHISRMPQCTLISTATSFNMSHARLMTYSSLAGIGHNDRRILPKITRTNLLKMLCSECLSRALGPQSFCWIGREFAYTAATFARRNDAMTCNSSCNRRLWLEELRLWLEEKDARASRFSLYNFGNESVRLKHAFEVKVSKFFVEGDCVSCVHFMHLLATLQSNSSHPHLHRLDTCKSTIYINILSVQLCAKCSM